MSLSEHQFSAFHRLEPGSHSSREVTVTNSDEDTVMGVITYNPPREQVRAPSARDRDPYAFRSDRPQGSIPGQTAWLSPRPGGLDNFFVHPDFQRQGVGKALINAAQEIHQQRFGQQSIAGPDPTTSLSKDTKAVMGSLGVSHLGEGHSEWELSKFSRDEESEDTVGGLQYELDDDPYALGRPIRIRSSLQDKMQVAGLAPAPGASAPSSDGSKQLSMLSKKRSAAPQVKKRLLQ